jgi:5'-nucleotidase / UDP-sugar diphosphatase
MTAWKLILTFFFLTGLTPTHAKLLQIIHTNDLHSYFQGMRNGLGGYARVKTIIDELRKDAEAKKIPSLYLDGGDFGEGSSFYFADRGVAALHALDLLGVDVAVLGNHDYILGGRELRRQMLDAKLKAKVISANVKGKALMGLSKLLPDHYDYDLDGLKVRIVGLTTSEIHYQYPFRPMGYVASSHNTGIKMAKKAKKEGVDFLVALTHIGLSNDIKLVTKSKSYDLIVGGHSHTKLTWPEMIRNKAGRNIPVLQAGANSLFVGSLLIDVQPNGESSVVDYRLFDINRDIPEDQTVKAFVQDAVIKREGYFNRSWNEVIGLSHIPLSGLSNANQMEVRTCWSRHLARMTRVAGKTDFGLQFDNFQGERIPAGTITFGDMVDNFPHFRKWGDQGWKVSKAIVSGFLLKKVLDTLASSEVSLQVTIDGLKAKVDDKSSPEPFDFTLHNSEVAVVEGKPINNLRYYSIALPSEVPYAVVKLFNVFGYVILNNLLDTKTYYWPMIEKYIRQNSPLECLQD